MKRLQQVLSLAVVVSRRSNIDLPEGIDVTKIDNLSHRIGMPIPDQLRNWLANYNGRLIGPGSIYGVRPDEPYVDIESRLHIHPYWIPLGWISVAGDGSGGYFVVVSDHQGGVASPVLFIDESDYRKVAYCVASNYYDFIWFFLQIEIGTDRWPFDREGILRYKPLKAIANPGKYIEATCSVSCGKCDAGPRDICPQGGQQPAVYWRYGWQH